MDGKLTAMKEISKSDSENTVVRKCEQCGTNNSIYNSFCKEVVSDSDKDAYLASSSLDTEFLLTFDVSDNFEGEYHSILLSSIRECTLKKGDESIDSSTGSSSDSGYTCGECAPIVMKTNGVTVTIDPMTKEVTCSGNDEHSHPLATDKLTLQEIIDYYFAD
jgi:hypothetical protein